jgi:hypothetical protein
MYDEAHLDNKRGKQADEDEKALQARFERLRAELGPNAQPKPSTQGKTETPIAQNKKSGKTSSNEEVGSEFDPEVEKLIQNALKGVSADENSNSDDSDAERSVKSFTGTRNVSEFEINKLLRDAEAELLKMDSRTKRK